VAQSPLPPTHVTVAAWSRNEKVNTWEKTRSTASPNLTSIRIGPHVASFPCRPKLFVKPRASLNVETVREEPRLSQVNFEIPISPHTIKSGGKDRAEADRGGRPFERAQGGQGLRLFGAEAHPGPLEGRDPSRRKVFSRKTKDLVDEPSECGRIQLLIV